MQTQNRQTDDEILGSDHNIQGQIDDAVQEANRETTGKTDE